ncbi:PKD domain-containing protein [Candidatus Nomurabacteria bacterium]|nr:PKD domain-containing protein [Candidatus Nomurabacteria bacterium]
MRKQLWLLALVGFAILPLSVEAETNLRGVLEEVALRLGLPKSQLSLVSFSPNFPPVINSLVGEKVLKVKETGRWTLGATDPEGGSMAYTFSWGDSINVEKTKPARFPGQVEQFITFNHAYTQPGSYTINALVTDDTGQMSKKSVIVEVR